MTDLLVDGGSVVVAGGRALVLDASPPGAATGGPQSLLAFWLGGAGGIPIPAAGGPRGMLAPWLGGAGGIPLVPAGGFNGLLAFWMGGAAVATVASEVSANWVRVGLYGIQVYRAGSARGDKP